MVSLVLPFRILPHSATWVVLFLLVASFSLTACQGAKQGSTVKSEPKGAENMAYRWGEMALLATANDTERFNPRPTITSRYLGLIFVAVFDAWAHYDEAAVPVYLTDVAKRPAKEHTLLNKETAISYAALGAMKEYYFADSALFNTFMREIGLVHTRYFVIASHLTESLPSLQESL
ncbi:MAG: DUF6851 domain-containing protein, partial [Bacteroidota bacterium]